MRVAFITPSVTPHGSSRSLVDLIDGLKEYGILPYVVIPREGDIMGPLRDRGVEVFVLSMPWWMSRCSSSGGLLRRVYHYSRWRGRVLGNLYRNLCSLRALTRKLRAWSIDVVYTNSSVIPIGALAAKWLRLPHVWHLREMEDLFSGRRFDWGAGTFRHVVGSADAVICVSKAVRHHLLGDVTNERVHIVYSGVAWEADFDRFRTISQAQSNRQEPYIFALVGKIHRNKGQERAIRALAIVSGHFPAVRLLIVGSGKTDSLRRLAGQLGVASNTDFWGYVPDPYAAFLASDAVLMCSKHEGMGRVTAEAMSACRPVIGSESGGTPELIEHGHTGLLYDGRPETLAACMIQFVQNPDWARQLGENGWQVARRKHSIESCAQSIYGILTSIHK